MISALLLFLVSCKTKENADPSATNFFPVSSFLGSQVAMVDSSLNSIMKITTMDGKSDTTYLKKEEFRSQAADFLSLPDLSSDELKDKYTETKLYDQELKRVVLNYTPKEPNAPIRRQEVIIETGLNAGDKVETIYIDQLLENGDSTVQKRLTWQVDRYFQVVTISNTNDTTEKIKILRLVWNPNP
jgi:hypothetical protein